MYWPNSLCCSVQFSYLFVSSYILPWIACHALLSRVKLRLGNLVTRPLNMIHWWYHNCCHNVCTKMPFLIETLIFCGHLLLEPNEWKTSIGLGYNKVVFRIALFDKSRVLSDLAPRMVPYRERERNVPSGYLSWFCASRVFLASSSNASCISRTFVSAWDFASSTSRSALSIWRRISANFEFVSFNSASRWRREASARLVASCSIWISCASRVTSACSLSARSSAT